VDALGRDFLVEVAGLGRAILDPKDGLAGTRTRGTLRELALSPAMELVPGFSLSGIDGRRYSFRSLGAVRFGGEPLRLGSTIDVLGLGVSHVADFEAALAAAGMEHHRGTVFYRLPAPEERFLLHRSQMEGILGGEAPQAAVAATVESQGSRGRRHRLAVTLKNSGQRATEIASIDHNFVELTAVDGYFSDARPGEFQRYQLLNRGPGGEVRPSIRQPDVVRLFRPILDLGDTVTSGTLQLTATGPDPHLRVTALFLLPEGELIRMPIAEWRP
jgi:hypothetical protein